MRCPRCGHANAADARFCTECGEALGGRCSACTQLNPPTSRFCSRCGTALPPASGPAASESPGPAVSRTVTVRAGLEGERKQVTVMFADLKGSLEMLAGRDPEEAQALLDAVLERMMTAVHEYGGTVNQVMGDGIMALFGAPLAQEDHALRACSAALRMLDLIDRYAKETRGSRSVEPQIRIGLNSGDVLVRSIASDFYTDYSAVGETTHLAARVEQLARPGTALLTAHTFRQVEGWFEVATVGDVPLKGLAVPVRVYELRRSTGARSRLDIAAVRGLMPFIGRHAETAALLDASSRTATGRAQVVAIVGEPGVGKSRLIWEFVRSAALREWRRLEAHAVPHGAASPYRPIIELLHGYFELYGSDDPAVIRAQVIAALGPEESAAFVSPMLALLGVPVDDPMWRQLDGDQKRRRTLEAVRYLLARGAQNRPLCVIVEDLHWADPETLAVLDALVDTLAGSRVLLIVSYRPEHRHEWGGRTYYRQVPVETFAGPETTALLGALISPDAQHTPLGRMLVERTGGNPFFLEETVRNLVETGALVGPPGQRSIATMPDIAQVPDTVQAALAARIDRLPAGDKRVLQTAAAIGRDVARDLLAAIADLPAEDLTACLGRLQSGEFLRETRLFPEVEYTFRHALTQEVAYGGLVRERRRALDARIVAALETRGAAETPIDHLAHHAWRGELWDKALLHCRQAGRQALARFAHRVAVTYFEQALTALGHLPEAAGTAELAIDLRLELRYALLPLGQSRRIREILTEARRLAEETDDRARLGRISCFLCNYLTLRFELPQAIEHGTEALAVAAAIGDPALARTAQAMLALAHYHLGAYRVAAEMGEQAAAAGAEWSRERFGIVRPPAVYGAIIGSWALAECGLFVDALRLAQRGLATAEAFTHPHSIIFGYLGVGVVHLRQGDVEAALAALERAHEIWGTSDLPAVLIEVTPWLSSAYAEAGRAADAIALLERAVDQAAVLRQRLGNALRSGGMAEAYLAAGRVEEAFPLAQVYVELTKLVNGRGHTAWALRLLGEIAARRDPPDVDTAEKALAEALDLARELGMRPLEARLLLIAGRLRQALGDATEAHRLITMAAGRFKALDMPQWLGACGTSPSTRT